MKLHVNDGTILKTGNAVDVQESKQTDSILPEKYVLHQNYPNPFSAFGGNPTTNIQFEIPATGGLNQHVSLKIYNVSGQLVLTLLEDSFPAGVHEIQWNGKDEKGRLISSGLYLLNISIGNFTKTEKMILGK